MIWKYIKISKVFEDIVLDNGDKLTNRANKYILTVNGLENDRKGKKIIFIIYN